VLVNHAAANGDEVLVDHTAANGDEVLVDRAAAMQQMVAKRASATRRRPLCFGVAGLGPN
jgi:hypothetical protein